MMLFDMIYSQSSDLASAESSVTAVVKPVVDHCESVGDTVDSADTVYTAAEPLPSSDG